MIRTALAASLTLTLASCANDALVFSSNQVIGIDISASPEAGNIPSLSVGYNLHDVAYVPVRVSADGQIVKGCYRTARVTDANLEVPCADLAEIRAYENYAYDAEFTNGIARSEYEILKTIQAIETDDEYYDEDEALDTGARAIDGDLDTDQHLEDAFSVFGTFRSGGNSSAGDTVKVGNALELGKIFATGAAAQHLGEGLSLHIRRQSGAQQKCLVAVGELVDRTSDSPTFADLKALIEATCPASSSNGAS